MLNCRWAQTQWWMGLLLVATGGCSGVAERHAAYERPFAFGADTFAYRNDLAWVYYVDPATGKFKHHDREPTPEYKQHCFVLARSARQFFQHARFDPTELALDEEAYRQRVRQVLGTSPRRLLPACERVVIPGYTNLFDFSRDHEDLLKSECGGAWQSYFQRGHWRMIFPFGHGHQEHQMELLRDSIRRNRPPVVHLVRFPELTINHAVVLFAVQESTDETIFQVYDPYDPEKPSELVFDQKDRQFTFPANDYFIGGRVNVYEVYCAWDY